MSDMVKTDADPGTISYLRDRLSHDLDLNVEEKASVARFLNDAAEPANPVAGYAVWQHPSYGSLMRLPGTVCAAVVAVNVAAAGLVVYFAGSASPSTGLAVLALLDGIVLLQCVAVLAARWRRGRSRARRTAFAAIVAFAISVCYNFALASASNGVHLDLVAGFGAVCMALPLAAAAFSVTRALQPPGGGRPLIGPGNDSLMPSGSGHLH